MGLIASTVRYLRSLPRRLTAKIGPYRWTDPAIQSLFGGRPSGAGVQVDADKAMSLSAVFAAVNLYSTMLAAFPLNRYRVKGGKKSIDEGSRVQYLLNVQPNPEMSAYTFRRTQEFHRLLWGHEYAEIEWRDDGQPQALWPIFPWRVRPARDSGTGELYYLVDGRRISPGDMLVNTLVSHDGVCGRSFVWYALDSLGVGIAGQDMVGAWFANGAKPGGILKHPGNPDKKARDELRAAWNDRHGGGSNYNKTGVVWGGWEFEDKGAAIPPDKSQLLESRRFFTEEVSRWLNIPPALLHDLSKAGTIGNVEEQGINLIVYSFGPVMVSKEQEYDRKLCDPPRSYTKHKVEGLLRAKSSERAAFFKELFMIGGMTINDILDLEDRNRIGPAGDVRFVPANMVPLEKAIAAPAPAPTQAPAPGQPQPKQSPQSTPKPPPETPPAPPEENRVRSAIRELLTDTLGRMLRNETNAARRAAKEPKKLFAWMDEFYAGHGQRLTEALASPCYAAWVVLGDRHGSIDWGNVAQAHAARSREALLELSGRVLPDQFAAEAETLFASWEKSRAAEEADRILEVICAQNHASAA